MVALQARNVTLRDLKEKFNLQIVEDDRFFREWQDDLPEISDAEKQQLDRVQSNFSNLLNYPPLLENTVKMVVLSRLLDLADFYSSPFHVRSEPPVRLESEDEGMTITGEIDVLVLCERIWILVIETKKVDYSLEAARSQLLAYMLTAPDLSQPVYGLMTNGVDFRFIKLSKQKIPQYAMSQAFNLFNAGNDLYPVLRILKRLGQIAQAG
jgi:Type I restriction enzyme R protein N terminus (HSDR_N)